MAKVGRPRTAIPEHDELVELGKDLVEWASDQSEEAKKECRWRFCDWYCIKQGFIKKQWNHMCEKPEFQAYHEQARTLLGTNYMNGSVNASIAHRFLWKYVDDVKEGEKEELAYKAALNRPDTSQNPIDGLNQFAEEKKS